MIYDFNNFVRVSKHNYDSFLVNEYRLSIHFVNNTIIVH
nr:MAG TPA: hypothetical protein [Caudoviricetes sp.]